MSIYETTATGKRCPLHDTAFDKDADCPRCVAVRRAIPVTDAHKTADSADLDAELLKDAEADISFAKYLHRVSRERIEDGNPKDWNAAAKLISEGTKLKYRAIDLKEKLSARAHSRYLVDHEKTVRGMPRGKGN